MFSLRAPALVFAVLSSVPAVAATCPGLAGGPGDIDGDGYVAAGGDCDDTDSGLWSHPGTVEGVALSKVGGGRLTWNEVADRGGSSALYTYEIVRSRVASNFLNHPTNVCLDAGGTQTQFTDPQIPPSGGVFYYLVRARNSCGPGSSGTRSNGTPRQVRDCVAAQLCDDSNACTRDSAANGVCLHEPIPPVILDPPASTAVCASGRARFRVEVKDAVVNYAWTMNGAPVGGNSGTLTLPPATAAADGAEIRVTATSACGSALSPPATLSVFSDSASCAGGLNGPPAPNGAGDTARMRLYHRALFKAARGFPESQVMLHSGELAYAETDLEIRGRGFDFAWTRIYRQRVWQSTSMGVGWTHSYDRHALEQNGGVVVFNPMSGEERFEPTASGCYESPGLFERLCPVSYGELDLQLAGGGHWKLAPIPGPPGAPGAWRISESRDAFGNTMTFAYDGAGRLSTITDTLGRTITVAYNARSLVESVTDFAGRSIHYAYCDGVEPGCDLDDLKSVTSPAVTGTPTGNDFPQGRTTTYTYSHGYAFAELNHNLLSISDASGKTFVRFGYSSADDPTDPSFDRLYQIETDDGSTKSQETYAYVSQVPDPTNGFAVSKTIVKDGSGNVGEYLYDAAAHLVVQRRYNGTVPDPSRFTGDVDNRPSPPPDPTQPPFVEAKMEYNGNALVTQFTVLSEGWSRTYDSGNPNPLKRGDLLHETITPGPLGGDQPQIDRSWTHATPFGTDWAGHEEYRMVHPPGTPPGTWRRVSDVRIVHPPGSPPGTWRQIKDIRIVHPPGTPPGTWRRISDVRIVHPPGTPPGTWRRVSDVRIVHPPGTPPGTWRTKKLYDSAESPWHEEYGARRVFNWTGIFDEHPDFERKALPAPVTKTRVDSWAAIVERKAFPAIYDEMMDFENDASARTIPARSIPARSIPARSIPARSIPARSIPARSVTRIDSWAAIVERKSGDYEKRDYCVQYQESDWDFIEKSTGNPVGGCVPCDLDGDGFMGGMLPFAGSPTTYTDPNGQTWTYTYDAAGFLTDIQAPTVVTGTLTGAPQTIHHHWVPNAYGQIVSYTDPSNEVWTLDYSTSGPDNGYLRELHIPHGTLQVGEQYTFDLVGRLTSITDANGHTTSFSISADDDVVRATTSAPLSYQLDYYYDANRRLTRTDVQNVDAAGVVRPNHHLSTRYDYDLLGRAVRASDEVDAPQCTIEEYGYDSESRLTSVRRGPASAGAPPVSVMELAYVPGTGVPQSVVERNGTTVDVVHQHHDAIDGLWGERVTASYDGLPGSEAVTTWAYDGYGRVTQMTDPEGSVSTFHYDPEGNVVSLRLDGELVDGVSGTNVRLAEGTATYDEIGRLLTMSFERFDRVLGIPLGSGPSGTTNFYNENSKRIRVNSSLSSVRMRDYDFEGRLRRETDALGNFVQLDRDPGGRVTQSLAYSAGTASTPPQTLTTLYEYDALDRLTAIVDPSGGRTEADYDSRGPIVELRDPWDNRTVYSYDGLGRLTGTEAELTDTGTGAGTVIATAVTTQTWDDLSRLTSATDEEGRTTSWSYDAGDRPTLATFADGTHSQLGWSARDDLTSVIDAVGNTRTVTYDRLGRPTVNTVAPVSGPTGVSTFKYDGAGAVVQASDDDSLVSATYDSLSNQLSETQRYGAGPPRTVTAEHDANGNTTKVTYPSGHNVMYLYDELDRPHAVLFDGGLFEGYSYFGDRLERISRANGMTTDLTYDTAGRLLGKIHSSPGQLFQQFEYEWSFARLTRLLESVQDEDKGWSHDSRGRLVHTTLTHGGQPPVTIDYALSLAGDRLSVTGGPDAGLYTRNPALPEPADAQMHQYTETPTGMRTYDKNGNTLTMSGGSPDAVSLTYDADGRIVSSTSSAGTSTYAYTAFGDLIDSFLNFEDDGLTSYRSRPIERYHGGTLSDVWIYGPEGVAGIVTTTDVDGDGDPDRYSLLTDHEGSVTGAVDASGNVITTYKYDDFGAPHASGAPIDNPFLYQGLIWSPRSNLYLYGGYGYDPRTGRRTSMNLDFYGLVDERGASSRVLSLIDVARARNGDPWQ